MKGKRFKIVDHSDDSEGEEIIEDYLEDMGISDKIDRQFVIHKMKKIVKKSKTTKKKKIDKKKSGNPGDVWE